MPLTPFVLFLSRLKHVALRVPGRLGIRQPYSLLLGLLAALWIWIIFYPGVFSADSIYFIFEATSGLYSDWHSPLIAFALALVPGIEENIGLVILAQILAGALGIRRLVISLSRFLGMKEVLLDGAAFFGLALFLSPLTPLAVYLATLWADTWLAILTIWIFALLLELSGETTLEVQRYPTKKIAAATLLICGAILVRSNAPVLYPALAVSLGYALNKRSMGLLQK